MRIIAGVAKGRTLSSVATATRPTSDRAREALFSTLTSEFGDFLGLHVLDLFAGTGAIGLEALSRGASIVHAVEKDENACKSISANSSSVEKAQTPGKFHLFSMSAQKFVENQPEIKYHFIYIDPPYDYPDEELTTLLAKLVENGFLAQECFIAVERATKTNSVQWPHGYEPVREKTYGQATIYYANAGAK
jgi:16S rRNA (guanine966-N2)-methyltransferase